MSVFLCVYVLQSVVWLVVVGNLVWFVSLISSLIGCFQENFGRLPKHIVAVQSAAWPPSLTAPAFVSGTRTHFVF